MTWCKYNVYIKKIFHDYVWFVNISLYTQVIIKFFLIWKKNKYFAEIPLSFIIRLCNYVLFLTECACSTIIDISPRIFSLMYCCCVSIIIVICMCPPVALIWLINLFLYLFLFRIISKCDDCNIHSSTPCDKYDYRVHGIFK
jgi:hypothetical protein